MPFLHISALQNEVFSGLSPDSGEQQCALQNRHRTGGFCLGTLRPSQPGGTITSHPRERFLKVKTEVIHQAIGKIISCETGLYSSQREHFPVVLLLWPHCSLWLRGFIIWDLPDCLSYMSRLLCSGIWKQWFASQGDVLSRLFVGNNTLI